MASTTALRAAALHAPTRLAHHARLVPQPSNFCRRAVGSTFTSVAPGAAVTGPLGASTSASAEPRPASSCPRPAEPASLPATPELPPVVAVPPALVLASSL